jgi:Uma2 family endonuclease
MHGITAQTPTIARPGEPVWEIAELFPEQGDWTEGQYLSLKTNRLVEFDNGIVEVLPVPTKTHQLIVLYFYELLKSFIIRSARGGVALVAPYRLRIPSGKFREPDVIYLTPVQDSHAGEAFTDGAELVMEIVSHDDPDRDYITKRRALAEAGVPEYWIIDCATREVLVLRLEGTQYAEYGRFRPGERAVSSQLQGFAVAVEEATFVGR